MSFAVDRVSQASLLSSNPQIDPGRDTGFARTAQGTDRQWTLDTDLAEIASDVYNATGAESIGQDGWTRVSDDTLAQAGITPAGLTGDSGFQAAIYTDGDGRTVVAFAGTDPSSVKDWLNNAQQAFGFDSAQYNQAIALGEKAVDAFGADNVVFTGHSLGGGLASAASLATGNPAVTFNAAGVGSETLDQLHMTQQQAADTASDGLIRRYNVENDILTGAQQGSGLPDALGYEITLENPNFIEDPIRAHLTDAVIEGMRSRDVKSEQNDSFLEGLADTNLFPGGPSASDIWQTGGSLVSALNPFD